MAFLPFPSKSDINAVRLWFANPQNLSSTQFPKGTKTDNPSLWVPLTNVLTEVTALSWTKLSGFIREKLPGRVPEGKKRASDSELRAVAEEVKAMILPLMDKGVRAEAEAWLLDALCAVMPRSISLWKKIKQGSAKSVTNTSQTGSTAGDTPSTHKTLATKPRSATKKLAAKLVTNTSQTGSAAGDTLSTPKTLATKPRSATKNLVAIQEVSSSFAPMKRSYSQSSDATVAVNSRPRLDIIHRNIEVWLGLQPDSTESITISAASIVPESLERTANASILASDLDFQKFCRLVAQIDKRFDVEAEGNTLWDIEINTAVGDEEDFRSSVGLQNVELVARRSRMPVVFHIRTKADQFVN